MSACGAAVKLIAPEGPMMGDASESAGPADYASAEPRCDGNASRTERGLGCTRVYWECVLTPECGRTPDGRVVPAPDVERRGFIPSSWHVLGA